MIKSQLMEAIMTVLIIHIHQMSFHIILLTKVMMKLYNHIEILPSIPRKLIIQERSL